jgi:hypothetical protein
MLLKRDHCRHFKVFPQNTAKGLKKQAKTDRSNVEFNKIHTILQEK